MEYLIEGRARTPVVSVSQKTKLVIAPSPPSRCEEASRGSFRLAQSAMSERRRKTLRIRPVKVVLACVVRLPNAYPDIPCDGYAYP